jgi:hypothetical protein
MTDLTVEIMIFDSSSIIIPAGALVILNIPREFSAI